MTDTATPDGETAAPETAAATTPDGETAAAATSPGLTVVDSTQQAEALVREREFLLLGFKAPWCPQCAPQRGVVQRVRPKFGARVAFAYLDLASDESGAQAFGVQALPTLLLFKHGEEAARLSGFTPAPKLISSLDALLADSAD